uniref:Uncharacterized protein n=1 Tax=Avena sativa TaxID=4498 RepID=A0ACD5TU89_AVESA
MESLRGSGSTGSGSGSERPRPHVVLLASPVASHVIPLAELARRLVEHHGLAVTLVTFANLSLLPAHGLASCLPPATVSTAVLPAVDMDDVPADNMVQVFTQLSRRSLPNLGALLRRISATAGPLAAFVPDIFCSEAVLVAGELGVPAYFFLPSNLNWLALERHLVELQHGLPPGEYRSFSGDVELGEGVTLRHGDLPALCRDPNSPDFQQVVVNARRYLLADGFLVNTFEEMEPALVEAFKLAAGHGAFPPVFATGPLIRRSEPEPDVGDRDCCLEWLDRQPIGSVVYVSFGSIGALSLEQTTEVAAGLEDSGQRFLWVVRMPSLTSESKTTAAAAAAAAAGGNDPLGWLPEGFLERTAGRGLAVRAWAPQVRVLSHPATAAFVSHCGWNSTLESVQSGVPMVALPQGIDQGMNATVLEGKKVGMALRPPAREDGIVVREEIATAVKDLLVGGEKGRAVRRRAGDMQRAAARAWLPEAGSSRRALEEVATKWKVLGLLDGTDAASEKKLEVEDENQKKIIIPNPAYSVWLSRDQTVLGFLVNSLSPEIIPHVVGLATSAEVWSVLTKMFSSHSRTKINHLRGALNNTKKNELTVAQFFATMKGFSSELAAAGKVVEEDEMVGYIINGLDARYNDLVSSVNGNPASPPPPTSPLALLATPVVTHVLVVIAVAHPTAVTACHVVIMVVETVVTAVGGAAMVTAVMGAVIGVAMMDAMHAVMMVDAAAMTVADAMTMEDGGMMEGVVVAMPPHPSLT